MNLHLISNAINGFVSLVIFLKVLSVYRKHRNEPAGETFRDFAMFFVMIAGYFLSIVISQLYFFDLQTVALVATPQHLFLILSSAYILALVAQLYGQHNLRKVILIVFLLFGVFTVIINILYLKPNIVEAHQGFQFQKGNMPIFVRVIDGLLSTGGAIFSGIMFLLQAKKVRESLAKRRSFFIGSGLLLLAVSAIIAFLIMALVDSAFVIFGAGLNAIPALFMIFYGLICKEKKTA